MKKLSDYLGEELIIIQPSIFKRVFEFRSSEALIAKMYYPKLFSSVAIIEGFKETLEIKKTSIWKSDIEIFKKDYQNSFAKIVSTNFWRTKGVIELPRGEILNLKFGAFKRSCEIYTQHSELLVLFKNKFSFKERNVISIEKRSNIIDENPWIIFAVWYKILEMNRKNSGIGAG